jgi:hypothetical protein
MSSTERSVAESFLAEGPCELFVQVGVVGAEVRDLEACAVEALA